MVPDQEGYISLGENDTSVSSDDSVSPTSAADGMELSDDSVEEFAKAGEQAEPCFVSDGPLKRNRQWLGWEPAVTPVTPARAVILQRTQGGGFTSQPKVDSYYPPLGIDHDEFCRDMNGVPLPHDSDERKNFDRQGLILGDPAACFDRPSGHAYDCRYDNPHQGFPEWKKIFAHILRNCGYLEDYDNIYVLFDTRNLADHQTGNPGLPHWPAAIVWWESRLQMTGPMGERAELCFFPATEATGFANVHPTWAGTFVLAALGASFPGKTFLLVS